MHAALLCALALGAGGCLMVGFDPLDDQAAGLDDGGSGGSGASAGLSGAGAGSGGASGQAGQGNAGGQGGGGGMTNFVPDAGAGTGGTMVTPNRDASVPDAGPPVITSCTGHDDFDPCEDGLYCSVNDYCFNEICIDGTRRSCGDECNTGTCNEDTDSCDKVPVADGTKCGLFNAFTCNRGACSSPLTMCTDGGDCTPDCSNKTCDISCPNTNSCESTCSNGAECAVDCQGGNTCKLDCEDSTCSAMCQGSGTCEVDCQGPSAVCAIFCTDASGCDQSDCLDGASCVLLCDEADSCGFHECWAGEQQCGNGKVACNASCD